MSLARAPSRTESFSSLHDAYNNHGSQDSPRKLSFNPAGPTPPPAPHQKRVTKGAFEVSKAKRVAQIAAATIYCLFSAGIVFGFAAIKPVLVKEGVYRDRCTRKELDANVDVCYKQELRLNLMFTLAVMSTNVMALPIGAILDRFGPRVTTIIGAVCVAIGCIFMAIAQDVESKFDAYIPGYLFLAVGGPFVFIASFQLSNAFPRNSGLILALLTGAFDTSSVIFLLYRLAYTQDPPTFQLKKFFLGYLVVPVYILVVSIFLMPGLSYKTTGELLQHAETATSDSDVINTDQNGSSGGEEHHDGDAVASEIEQLLGSKDGSKHARDEDIKREISGVWGALHSKTAWQQIRSPWFILITVFTMLQMTRINFFIATIRQQYKFLLPHHSDAVRINTFFDAALPLGGVVSVPFIGIILDRTSTVFVLFLLVLIASFIGVLGLIPFAWAGYIKIVLFVVYRPFYYTAVSDYSAKVFGFETFGKVYGLLVCLAGLFNFSQTGLDALMHRAFHGDPRQVNAILLALGVVIGLGLVLFVWKRSHKILRELLEEEAEGAQETLMPGHDERVHEDHHPSKCMATAQQQRVGPDDLRR